MKIINNKIIEKILYRCPINNIDNIKNLNIYNKPSNNNVLFDNNAKYYIIKPKGKKSYVWFTYIDKKLIALLIILNNKNVNDNSNEFYDLQIEFDNELCYNNVLLYGYLFKNTINKISSNYFVIENIFNYNFYNKSILYKPYYNNNFNNKLALFNIILPMITNKNNNYIKLPIIVNNIDELYKLINNLYYNLFCINVYSTNRFLGSFNLNISKNSIINATFKITPCINQDLYNLFIMNNNKEEFYDIALIDSYKTSILMNNLFRKIKENKNLDLLEESDDEDEFENISENKYVNLDSNYIIDCEYNSKFKKWIPRKVSNNKIINKQTLNNLISKKKYTYSL